MFFFFKQKTAYEMRISDWSSDMCSSDLKPKNVSRFMQAAEKYDRLKRLAHRRDRNNRENGAIGHVGLEVLRELLRLIDYKTGRLDPAIATLALRVGRSIAAVVDAVQSLGEHTS